MTNALHHRLIVGYHACDRTTRDAVLLGGESLRPSVNTYDWLGKGIYFWEHGPKRAKEYGVELTKRKGTVKDPVVVGAYIHLGECLDLMDAEAPTMLARNYNALKAVMQGIGREMPINSPARPGDHDIVLRHLDCAVINFAIDDVSREEHRTVYQTVRGAFQEGGPAYPGACIHRRTHIQVAVRDPTCILGYFLPSS